MLCSRIALDPRLLRRRSQTIERVRSLLLSTAARDTDARRALDSSPADLSVLDGLVPVSAVGGGSPGER